MSKTIVIIGGGAAGFFCAINCALQRSDYHIIILEKSNKLLAKVRISGGGRCNVTNATFDNTELVKNYPRGKKELLQVFSKFTTTDTIAWFKAQGVLLKTEADGRMFPVSDSSETIINCFMQLCNKLGVTINTSVSVNKIIPEINGFTLKTGTGTISADSVVCAFGGHNKAGGYDLLTNLGHTIMSPIPSLFTFNLPGHSITKALQGVSVSNAEVSIPSSKIKMSGPLLVTHWGLSGPAVLKLSAFGAEELHKINYTANVKVNWCAPLKIEQVFPDLKKEQQHHHRMLVRNLPLFGLPKRLWEYLLSESDIPDQKIWAELSDKSIRKLSEMLCNSSYAMSGKTTFKEEFVTGGGITLKEVDFKKMESKMVPNLYFCGECLNIDGITGGFNFQNAWSTAFVAAKAICA